MFFVYYYHFYYQLKTFKLRINLLFNNNTRKLLYHISLAITL
jgi:hypothetical protein